MQAVVIERPGEAVFTEVETPVPGPDDVLVRSLAAGVCRTDLEILEGRLSERWVRFPCIPGHEWSGTVAEVGGGVTDLAPRERVVCEGMIPCNACRRCKAGETQLCERYDQLGFTRGGGYGEHVLVPRRVVHRLPEHVSLDAAVLVEPASCVLRALERTRPEPGDAIGVIGDLAVIGSCSYTAGAWTRVLRLLESRLVDFDPIVTHRFPARGFEQAFALLGARQGLVAKVLLEHSPAGDT